MTMPVYAVTGASGHLGRFAIEQLLARGVPPLTSSPWCATWARPPGSPPLACRCARWTIPARRHWARRWPASTGCCWSPAASSANWPPSTPTSSRPRGRPGSHASCTRACLTLMTRLARWPAPSGSPRSCPRPSARNAQPAVELVEEVLDVQIQLVSDYPLAWSSRGAPGPSRL